MNDLLGELTSKSSKPIKSRDKIIEQLPNAIEDKETILVSDSTEKDQIIGALKVLKMLAKNSSGKELEDIQKAIKVLNLLM